MIIHTDKDGVLAQTRKAFDREIRTLFPVADCIPEILPNYELLGHYADDSEPCAAYFRRLTGRGDDFDFRAYLGDYCETLKRLGIWRKFPYHGAPLYLLERLRDACARRGEPFRLRVVTASGTNPEDRELVSADTRAWLAQGGLPDAELVNDTKKERYPDCDLWIEDMPHYVAKIMKAGYRGRFLLVDACCNKEHALKHVLTAEELGRVHRILPSLEVHRSEPPVRSDAALALGGENAHQRALADRVSALAERIADEGLTVTPDPNHLEGLFEGPPALAFVSGAVSSLVSLLGTDAASAVASRAALRMLERTLARAKSPAERDFVATRAESFKRGWPLYVHFEFRNNEHLYNADVVGWTVRFAEAFRRGATLAAGGPERCRLECRPGDAAARAFLRRAFALKRVEPPFERTVGFFDGTFSVRWERGRVALECAGPRAPEARERVARLQSLYL